MEPSGDAVDNHTGSTYNESLETNNKVLILRGGKVGGNMNATEQMKSQVKSNLNNTHRPPSLAEKSEKADVKQVANFFAEWALEKRLETWQNINRGLPTAPANGTAQAITPLENDTESSLSIPEQGGIEDMARLKAKILDKWVTGDTPQQLVNNALAHKEEKEKGNIPTFREYAEKHMQLYKENAVAVNTLVGYRGYLDNHLYPVFADMRLDEITPDNVQDYINAKAKTHAEKSIKEHMAFMGEIFDFAKEDKLVQDNPVKSKKVKIIGKKSVKVTAYTNKEYGELTQTLLPALDGPTKLYAAISLYTGARQGEICALQWQDVDFEKNRLNITKSVAWGGKNKGFIKEPKTENGERCIVIMGQLLDILKEEKRESGYLIYGERAGDNIPISHESLTRLNERIHFTEEKEGVKARFSNRRARHTMATYMNNAQVDSKTLQAQMGHYNIDFTRKQYMNPQEEQEDSEMQRLADYIAKISVNGTKTEQEKCPETLTA